MLLRSVTKSVNHRFYCMPDATSCDKLTFQTIMKERQIFLLKSPGTKSLNSNPFLHTCALYVMNRCTCTCIHMHRICVPKTIVERHTFIDTKMCAVAIKYVVLTLSTLQPTAVGNCFNNILVLFRYFQETISNGHSMSVCFLHLHSRHNRQ